MYGDMKEISDGFKKQIHLTIDRNIVIFHIYNLFNMLSGYYFPLRKSQGWFYRQRFYGIMKMLSNEEETRSESYQRLKGEEILLRIP